MDISASLPKGSHSFLEKKRPPAEEPDKVDETAERILKKAKTSLPQPIRHFQPLKTATVHLHLIDPWNRQLQRHPEAQSNMSDLKKQQKDVVNHRLLGEGAFSHVFQSHLTNNETLFAFKVNRVIAAKAIFPQSRIGTSFTADDAEVAHTHLKNRISSTLTCFNSIKREINILDLLRDLQAPHVPRSYGAVLLGPLQIGFGMPIYGKSLKNLLDQKGTFSLSQIKDIGRQLFTLLAKLDSAEIAHCDLKPENLLRDDELVVIDWGLARKTNPPVRELVQSRFYRAPEVALKLPCGTAIDWWSAGCILFKLYTDLSLFPSCTDEDHFPVICGILGLPPPDTYDDTITSTVEEALTRPSCRQVIQEMQSLSPKRERDLLTDLILQEASSRTDAVSESLQFADLIRKLLHYSPKARLAPDKALAHPFLEKPAAFPSNTQ